MYKVACVAFVGASLVAAPLGATCWTADQVDAAKVRDLDTMLMVSALRCRNSGSDLLERYNAFVERDRPALQEANGELRAHFVDQYGPHEGLRAYDNYVTAVANRYGAGTQDLDCFDMESIVDAAAGEDGSVEGLIAVAERAAVEPILDDRTCTVEVAAFDGEVI